MPPRSLSHGFIGRPLSTADAPHQTLGKAIGWAVFEGITANRQPSETLTMVVSQFMPPKRWHNALHMCTADVLRQESLTRHGVVVTDVPHPVHKEQKEQNT